ncbi:DMT family transporter [Vibrio sp. DW001]|uniref:DMT family transporter n=1 Tax=Vibrio sp. DW001 TaxID=2912315 RepID=UPI0023B077E8|nr:DMT family transporter [Vibrio sp. DW001]WED29584.1 DMT family transporter [Vibrio sp. DW001]
MMPIISNLRPLGVGALSFAFALSVWQVVFALPLFIYELRNKTKGIFGSKRSPQERNRIILTTLFTGSLFGLSTYLYVLGIEKAGAVNTSIAIQAYPLFVILWESLFLKRKKSPVELALTAGLVIILYYLGTDGTLLLSGVSTWFLVSLCIPLLWSIAHVIIKEELGRTPITPIQVTFFRVAISALFLSIALTVIAPNEIIASFDIVFQATSVIMGLVYFLELILWFYAVRYIDVSFASSIITPWPAVTMVLAYLFLGDQIELFQITGGLILVLCIYGLTLAKFKKESDI